MLKELITNRKQIEKLCRQHHVRQLAVFGSALRADFDPSRSDIDFAVEFLPLSSGEYADNYFSLQNSLASLFGRKVDLISARNIRNPYFRQELETSREVLYAA